MAAGMAPRGEYRAQTRSTPRKLAHSQLPQRIQFLFILSVVLFLALAGRLFVLMVVQHKQFQKMAQDLRKSTDQQPARRGVLLARDGTLLVSNEPSATIVLDPNAWYVHPEPSRDKRTDSALETPEAQRQTALDGLASLLPGVDVADLALRASVRTPEGRFRTVDVRRHVDASLSAKIRDARLPGVGIFPTTKRVAMNGTLAAHVLGFTDPDGIGLDGLEKGLEGTLAGKPGIVKGEFDPRHRLIPGTVKVETPARDGRDVLLTLDANLQGNVQEALKAAYEKYHAEAATAVVLDPKTGDILALANFPTYNVNERSGTPIANRINRAVTAPFEPGSTLKTITIAAALEENKVTPHSRFFCNGSRNIGRRTIHCHLDNAFPHGHQDEDLTDVIRNSCNIATAECAFLVGKEKLWEYEHRFGLGQRTGSGLPGESRGQLSSPDHWSNIQLANVAFGQGISVTPLQLAGAYAAIANNGVWMRPRIVRGTRSGDGSDLRENAPEAGHQAVSPETAREMRRMLQTVVDNGTGRYAALNGYTAGGKTGTAQIAEHGHYGSRFVASFVGMAPMSDPQFVILVSVTAPHGDHFGATVSAPVFKQIAEKALLARRTPRDKPDPTPGTKTRGKKKPVTLFDA